jgi:hypothetical protein
VLAGSARAAGGEPKHDFKPPDQALARSIALKRSDLPRGYQAATSSDPEPEASGPHCKGKPDESDLTLTGKIVSRQFFGPKDSSPNFFSGASVFRSAGQAQTAFQREMRAELARCMTQTTISDFASGAISLKLALVSQTLKPLSGLGGQAATLRLVFKPVDSPRLHFAEDLLVLRKGRVEAWLVAKFLVNLQTRFAFEQRLLAKLAARMP